MHFTLMARERLRHDRTAYVRAKDGAESSRLDRAWSRAPAYSLSYRERIGWWGKTHRQKCVLTSYGISAPIFSNERD